MTERETPPVEIVMHNHAAAVEAAMDEECRPAYAEPRPRARERGLATHARDEHG